MNNFVQDYFDAAHTSFVAASTIKLPLRVQWKYPCESLSTWEPAPATKYSKKTVHEGPYLLFPGQPLIGGDCVVFTDGGVPLPLPGSPPLGSIPATIHCVRATTGERLWRRLYGDGEMIGVEALVAGGLIVHSWSDAKAALRALSISDGTERWARLGCYLSSGLLVAGGDLVGALVSQEAKEESRASLTRIDGTDGATRWTTLLPVHDVEIACDDQAVYASETDSGDTTLRIASHWLADGRLRWAKDIDLAAEPLSQEFRQMLVPGFGRPYVNKLAVAAGLVYVCFQNTAIACLDAGNGSLLWVFAEQLGSLITTVLMNDGVCTTWDQSQGNHTYCRINPKTGELLLKRKLPPKRVSAGPHACAADDIIFMGRQELCALSAATGELLWESDVGLEPYDFFSGPRIGGGRLYANRSGDCCVYCFG